MSYILSRRAVELRPSAGRPVVIKFPEVSGRLRLGGLGWAATIVDGVCVEHSGQVEVRHFVPVPQRGRWSR